MMNLTAKQHEQFVAAVSRMLALNGAKELPVTYERLQRLLTGTRKNPATPANTFTLRVERTGYGDMVTASAGGKVLYGGDPNRKRDLDILKERVRVNYPNAVFVWAKATSLDRETLADLAVDSRKINPVRPRTGETDREFVSRCMSAEKEKFPRQDQRVAVCLSKARRNPSSRSFAPVLLTKDGGLRLAEHPNELESFRSRGWTEAPMKLHTKLDRLRALDANGWATLADSEFTAAELDEALATQARGTKEFYGQLPV